MIKLEDSQDQYRFTLNGELHRPNGPARAWKTGGSCSWWLFGNRHRYYGPAFLETWWVMHGQVK